MKKTLLFLSLILLLSCNKEYGEKDIVNNESDPSINESSFKVEKSDIEKAVNGFMYEANTRSKSHVCKIIGIDSIKTQDSATKGTAKMKESQSLLYFVKLSDGSTVMISGDKRAEPIYAHFRNLDLKFDKGELLEQDQIPEPFLFMIGTAATSIINQINTNLTINPHWTLLKTKSSENDEYILPSKCTANWGQGNPFNLKSPTSNGEYADNGQAAAGCVTIAVAQALTVLKNNFNVFKGYELKTSWSKLKAKKYYFSFTNQDEKDDISNIIKTIAENISISYDDDGSAGADTQDAITFLNDYLGGMFSYDTNWGNIENNMKGNSHGISFLSGNRQSNGWIWKTLGIKMPRLTGHCMLLDGYKKMNGKTLFYINFGWNGTGNGYYLYDDKTWSDNAEKQYSLRMKVHNFHIDTDYDDF